MQIMSFQNNIPPEIVYEILTYQFRDYMSNDYPPTSEKFNENLKNFVRSNLTVNKTFYHCCVVLLYKHCNFTTAKRFYSLLHSIEERKELRKVIQVADFQELTSIGLGRSNEMNKQIQNLTNETLLKFLRLTKSNLREFLASENIQDDLDDKIIYELLKPGKILSILDLCGCSGPNLTKNFNLAINNLYPEIPQEDTQNLNILQPLQFNYQITCLGLHDCTDLPKVTLGKLLKLLPELQKLDLSHTQIDGPILLNCLPHLKNLTHISLASCSQLLARYVLEFFAHHPAVTDEKNNSTLEWINLSDLALNSNWNHSHTMFLLKKFCQFGHNKTIQYLNLDGLPLHLLTMTDETYQISHPNFDINEAPSITSFSSASYLNHSTIYSTVKKTQYYYQCNDTLIFIKLNFPNLKSLSVKGNNIPMSKLIEFLSPINNINRYDQLTDLINQPQQKLKFINLSNNVYVNRWTINDPNLLSCSPSLCGIELNFNTWQQIEKMNSNNEMLINKYNFMTGKNETIKWKCFMDVSYGRRHWIYRTDPYLNRSDIISRSQLSTHWDENGNKIIDIVKQPDFLKFAQNKISMSCGLINKSNVRRQLSYRDLKPPISYFFTRNGGISFGNVQRPLTTPSLQNGNWRVLPDDEETMATTDDDINENERGDINMTNDETEPFTANNSHTSLDRYLNHDNTNNHANTNGLYWDRSSSNLNDLSPESFNYNQPQNDEEYLNDPTLQRRRSEVFSLITRRFVPTNTASDPTRRLLSNHSNGSNSSRSILMMNNNFNNEHGNNNNNNNNNTNIFRTHMGPPPRTSSSSNKRFNTHLNNTSLLSHTNNNLISDMHNHDISKKQIIKRPKGWYYTQPEEFIYDVNDDITTKRYQIHFETVQEYKTFGCIERGMYRYYGLRT